MPALSLKLPRSLLAKLDAVARRRKTTKSAVLREALESYFKNGSGKPKVSAYDLAKDLCGRYEGPRDLSTNPKHMEGYGR